MARRTLCTPETIAILVSHISKGNYRATACAAAGIHRQTLLTWEKWGAEGVEPYAGFVEALATAEAEAEMALLEEIRTARPATVGVGGADVWQAKAWMMERRYGARWAARVKQQTAEAVDALTEKLKADPELHKKVLDILAENAASAPAQH